MINKIIKSTSAVVFNSLFTALLGFILVPIILSNVGQEKYGLVVLTVFLSVRNGVLGIFIFGVQAAITKFVAQYTSEGEHNKINVLLNTGWLFYLFVSSTIVTVLWLFKRNLFEQVFNVPPALLDQFLSAFDIALFSIFFQFINLVFLGYFEGLHKFMTSKLIDTISYLLYFTLAVSALFLDHDFDTIVRLLGLMPVVIFLMSLYFFRKYNTHYKLTISDERPTQVKLAKYCGALFSGAIAGVLYNQSPKFFVTTFLSPAALAIYDIVSKIPALIKTIVGLGNSVVVPTASELLAKGGKDANQQLFSVGLKLNFLLFVPFISCLALMSENLLAIWVGEQYIEHAYLMQTLFLVPLLSLFISHGNAIFLGINYKMGLFSFFGWLIFGFCAGFIYLFVDQYGVAAVASGRVFGLAVIVPISMAIFFRYFKVAALPFIARIVVLALALAAPASLHFALSTLFAKTSFIGFALLYPLLYASYAVLIYLFVLDSVDKGYVKKIVGKVSGRLGLGRKG